MRALNRTCSEQIIPTDVTLVGLEVGLRTMKKGEFSRFLIQPQYAYGDVGCPPLIPAAAVVLYEVHVLDYLDSGQVDAFVTLSPVGTLPVSAEHRGVVEGEDLLVYAFVHLLHVFSGVVPRRLCHLQGEQNTFPLSRLIEVVNTLRSFGNRCFRQHHYDNAKDRYKEVELFPMRC